MTIFSCLQLGWYIVGACRAVDSAFCAFYDTSMSQVVVIQRYEGHLAREASCGMKPWFARKIRKVTDLLFSHHCCAMLRFGGDGSFRLFN